MAHRLVAALTLAALLAACSRNTSTAGSTIDPGSPNASTTDAGRDGRAGPGGPGGRGGFGRADQALLRGITLSADQQQRIDTIRTRYRTQMEQMRQQNSAGTDRDAARGQMRSMMEKQQAEIRAVLTADQQRQFDQNLAEMRGRMERGGGRPGGAPPR